MRTLRVRQTGSNTFRLGQVEFDKYQRIVSFPARVAVRTQAVEYAVVNERGKAYESVLITEANPSEVHVACLLLGLAQRPLMSGATNGTGSDAIRIQVWWKKGEQRTNVALFDLLELVTRPNPKEAESGTLSRVAMPGRFWVYNGLVFDDFGFAAQREGSIVSLIRDSAALVNNPGEDRDDDDIHFPNVRLLPATGTEVQVVMELQRPLPGAVGEQNTNNPPITPLSRKSHEEAKESGLH